MKHEQPLITLSDILLICKRSRSAIIASILTFASLALLYTLTRPVEFKSEATFREKAKTNETAKSSSLAMIIGMPELNENAAISLMKSRKLIERTIQERGLQAKIGPTGIRLLILRNIPKNLVAEYAHLTDSETVLLADPTLYIKARDIEFHEESPLQLRLRFVDEQHYQVSGPARRDFGTGTLGVPFQGPSFAFTLLRTDSLPISKRQFKMNLKPLSMVAEELVSKIHAEPDYMDKGLLNLSFRHTNRQEAALFLNTLMALYQKYLREEHQRITGEQVAYLNRRQDETAVKLHEIMRDHAQALSENMATIEFLFQNQQSFSQKLLMIDFELKRLDKALNEGLANYDRLSIETGDPLNINLILSEMRRHKQHADTIDMALRNIQNADPKTQKLLFAEQMQKLETLRMQSGEAKKLLAALEDQKPLPASITLLKNSKYMIREWRDKLVDTEKALQQAPAKERESSQACHATCLANFQAYLGNMLRLFAIEERLQQERLSHLQSPQSEFQGINLNTASQLYVNYSKNLNDIEADILHYQFILDQMLDPAFEPSSLSTVLEDPVSREIISRAGNIGLQLKDDNNHSPRELERLKLDLAQQKAFLSTHAGQTLQLLKLRQKLYQEKIVALHAATRELLQQEISLLENSLADYLSSRIGNLKHEKSVIEQQQLGLRHTMQKMPAKWAAEKLVDQHLETNRKMVEEISKMVESKNIALNLDLSQSAPVDAALPSLNPESRKSLLFLIIGALFGAFSSIGFLLSRAVATGLPATHDSLTHMHQHVSGSISADMLDTLRRAEAHLCQGFEKSQSLLLLIGTGPDYSQQFAELLKKSGKRVLLLSLSFGSPMPPEELPGLLQYLEGEASDPKILKTGIDHISSGGFTRFSSELLLSKRFQTLNEKLLQQYDWILAVSRSPLTSGEAETQFGLFNHALITITDEKLKDLRPYLDASASKRISFLSLI
ncbi:MAG: hypothetical protein LLG04_04405 [Parachlamydia sp.]|nr:hypothetical protein [Parachlamydia sp.]